MTRWRSLAAAVALLGAVVGWPQIAGAQVNPVAPGVTAIPSVPGLSSIPGLGGSTSNCKDPPPVEQPGTGITGIFVQTPPDLHGKPPATQFETRGLAGLSWSLYDPGCPGNERQPAGNFDTMVGNLGLGTAAAVVAFADGLHQIVSPPTFLHSLDTMVNTVTGHLADRFYGALIPLSLLLLAVLMMIRSWKGDVAGTLKKAGWAILVMGVLTFVFRAPTRLGDAAASVETQGTGLVASALTANGASPEAGQTSLEVQSVLYPIWLRGELGVTAGPLADKYGPALLDGQSFTWAETASGKTDAGPHNKEFADAAAGVHDADQGAYDQLKGQVYHRWLYGVYAMFGVLCTVPFLIAASVLVVASLLIILALVMFSPVLGVLAVHDRFSPLLRRSAEMALAAIINAVLFSAGAAINTAFVGMALDPATKLPGYPWFPMVACMVFTFLAWYALRPMRRLTHMVNTSYHPADQAGQGIRDLGGRLEWAAKTGVGAAVGYYSVKRGAETGVEEAIEDERDRPEARPVEADMPQEPAAGGGRGERTSVAPLPRARGGDAAADDIPNRVPVEWIDARSREVDDDVADVPDAVVPDGGEGEDDVPFGPPPATPLPPVVDEPVDPDGVIPEAVPATDEPVDVPDAGNEDEVAEAVGQ